MGVRGIPVSANALTLVKTVGIWAVKVEIVVSSRNAAQGGRDRRRLSNQLPLA